MTKFARLSLGRAMHLHHCTPVLLLLLCASASLGRAVIDYCTVCQDGSDILDPEALIEEIDQTCGDLAEEASYYTDPIACRYYHRYGNACGCNNIPPQESFCSLCQGVRDQIEDSSFWLDGYDTTCGVMETDAAWNLLSTFTVDEDDPVNIDQDNCNYYHHIGSLCGCKHNRPPENGCTLCLDGSKPLLPDKVVTPNNAAEHTCAAFSHYTQYQHVQGTEECQKLQAIVGSFCGCTSTPVNTSVCDFCPPGLVTREGWAPDVEFGASNKLVSFRDASCIKVSMLASAFDIPCGNTPRDFVEGCCEPATELWGPEVLVQRQPESVKVTYHGLESTPVAVAPIQLNWDEFVFLSAAANPTSGRRQLWLLLFALLPALPIML